ncbi:uncharacterized protein LOC129314466 [Prosopis cineraria]|uniref:uncharacterized protein LOC129314466 n=1 Tax=Prosopis cineraria TaxID=364024 RepID=UPI00240FFB40|nr:uncharacterized protein LOC129314466 [Prosopis cineraria]
MESSKAKTDRSKINHNASFKTKLCLCFKPVSSVDDDAFEPATFSTFFSSALLVDCREGTGGWRRSSKKKGDDDDTCFWQILKKALNDTTLMKKIQRRKAASKSKISRSSRSMKLEQKIDKNSKQECKSSRISLESSNSSLFTRSSLSSSTNSSSSSQTPGTSSSPSFTASLGSTTVKRRENSKVKDKEKGTDPNNNRTEALCIILITSLLILILWGKVFAIICVSFWLYLLPRRSEQNSPPGQGYKEEEEFDTVEYKKKVIMEGLLERNRSRLTSMDSIARPCA